MPQDEASYEAALRQLRGMLRERDSSPARRRALAILLEDYERRHHPIEAPDPIAAIRSRMQALALSQAELARLLEIPESRVSELLSGRRGLNLALVRKLARGLRIPLEVLVGIASDEPQRAVSSPVSAGLDAPLMVIGRRALSRTELASGLVLSGSELAGFSQRLEAARLAVFSAAGWENKAQRVVLIETDEDDKPARSSSTG